MNPDNVRPARKKAKPTQETPGGNAQRIIDAKEMAAMFDALDRKATRRETWAKFRVFLLTLGRFGLWCLAMGYALSFAWAWALVPFGLPALGILQGAALILTIRLLTSAVTGPSPEVVIVTPEEAEEDLRCQGGGCYGGCC